MANILSFPDSGQLGENEHFHSEKNGKDTKSTYKSIPTATGSSNGLMSATFFSKSMTQRGTLTVDTDIDSIKEFGCYQTTNTTLFPWGILLVFNSGTYVLQLYMHIDSKTVLYRVFYREWYPVYSFATNAESASNYTADQQRSNTQSPPPRKFRANQLGVKQLFPGICEEYRDTG